MEAQAKCKYCSEEFVVNKDDVEYMKRYATLDNKDIFLTYYNCPKCGRSLYVQIDNRKTYDLANWLKKEFAKLYLLKKKGQNLGKRSAKFEEKNKYLNELRKELVFAYDQKQVVDIETGDLIRLEFTK